MSCREVDPSDCITHQATSHHSPRARVWGLCENYHRTHTLATHLIAGEEGEGSEGGGEGEGEGERRVGGRLYETEFVRVK